MHPSLLLYTFSFATGNRTDTLIGGTYNKLVNRVGCTEFRLAVGMALGLAVDVLCTGLKFNSGIKAL